MPSPSLPTVQHDHDLDFVQNASTGGSDGDSGSGSASGQVDMDGNASGMVQAAAGPAAAVKAVGDSSPAAAATAASSTAEGPEMRGPQGDNFLDQGAPKRRNITLGSGVGSIVSGSSVAADAVGAAVPEDGPEDTPIWAGSGMQEQGVGQGASAGGGGGGGGVGIRNGSGGMASGGENEPGVVEAALAGQDTGDTSPAAAAEAGAAGRPGEFQKTGVEGARKNEVWGLLEGAVFGRGPGAGTRMSRHTAAVEAVGAATPEDGSGDKPEDRPISVGSAPQEQDIGSGAGRGGVNSRLGGKGGSVESESVAVEAAPAGQDTNYTSPSVAPAGGTTASSGEWVKTGGEEAEGTKGRSLPKRGIVGWGLAVGANVSGWPATTDAVGAGTPEDWPEDTSVWVGSGRQEEGVGQGASAGGGGGSSRSGGQNKSGEVQAAATAAAAAAAAAAVPSWSSFGRNAAMAASAVPSWSVVGSTAAAAAATGAAAAAPMEPGEVSAVQAAAAGTETGMGAAAGAQSGTESGPVAAVPAVPEGTRMGTGAAAAVSAIPAAPAATWTETETGTTATTEKDEASAGGFKRKRRGAEDDEGQSAPRSKRRDGGSGARVGGDIVGAIGEPAAQVPAAVQAPASTKRSMRSTTTRKTAESLRAKVKLGSLVPFSFQTRSSWIQPP